jgi:hypothetical protein
MGDAYREDPESRRQMQAMKKELDQVTDMLCQVMSMVSAMNMGGLPPDAQKWYEAHTAWDRSQGRK